MSEAARLVSLTDKVTRSAHMLCGGIRIHVHAYKTTLNLACPSDVSNTDAGAIEGICKLLKCVQGVRERSEIAPCNNKP